VCYLFIDSSYELTIGLLRDDFQWLSFESISGVKSSAIIQTKCLEIMDLHQKSIDEIKGIILVSGPGFYTGLRLAEGFSDIFKFFGHKIYSFYSFEIPLWCGHDQGVWFTKAYRGEYFLYSWKMDHFEQRLLSVKQLQDLETKEQFFIHSHLSLDDHCRNLIQDPIATTELLKAFPQKIFPRVLSGINKESFYFRAPEDEFKVNP
jgi:tRNA threonylcarbamoyladenosine biosynthesis protein TsaB